MSARLPEYSGTGNLRNAVVKTFAIFEENTSLFVFSLKFCEQWVTSAFTFELRVAEHSAEDVSCQILTAPPMINADWGKKSFSLMKRFIIILESSSGTPVPEKTFVSKLELHILII